VQPGARSTVKAIEITGNKKVSDRTISRLLRFKPGDLYRRSDVLETQRELYLSGLFKEVAIVSLSTDDSAKTIALQVEEAGLRQLNLATGFTTADFLQLEAEFTRYNFLGSARRLTLRGTVSNLFSHQLNGAGIFYDVTNGAEATERERFLQPTWAASIDFTQPWFLSAHNQLGASIFTHRRSIPGVVTDNGGGATIAFTRDLGVGTNATLGYTYESSRIEASDVYFCVSVGLCVSSAIRVISDRHPLSPLSLVAQYDGTNDAFNPNHGVRARLDLEHASRYTGSEFEYNRVYATASTYRRAAKRVVLAGRVKLGWVAALPGTNHELGLEGDSAELVVHPRKQFFAGGSQSVRGYGENQLGPRVLTIDPSLLTVLADTARTTHCSIQQLEDGSCDPNLPGLTSHAFQPRPLGGSSLAEMSIELRFPLRVATGLSGAVFIDGAIVGTKRFSDLLGATATITPGFGIRFATPAGPVRLDLGIRPRVVERLPVITQVTAPDGSFQLVTLKTLRRYNQAEATAGGGVLGQILSRLTLHLAIGPAF
ncbi:MAG: BamA/TamA family outer membrane protein, partial [Gemmatimonadaceae bacterium]